MTEHATVAPAIVARIRTVCMDFPETREEQAWVGTRWRIRTQTFAHVLAIASGRPPAYAQAAGSDGPLIVITFRLPPARLETPRFTRLPFFKPVWWPDIIGMSIDDTTDWDAVADLLTESYCLLAPQKLAALVDRSAD